MAGAWQELFSQGFNNASSIVVNHNLNRVQLAVMVLVDGISRTDLIQEITLDENDPRNSLTVDLSSPQQGTILIVDMNVAFASIRNPQETAELQIAAGNVFGNDYQSATDKTFRSTTSTAFSQVQRLTTSSLPAGKYRVECNYIWSGDSTLQDFICRVEIDDSINIYEQTSGGNGAVSEHRQEPKDSAGSADGRTNQRHVTSFWADVSLNAGVHTIDIDIASSQNGTAMSCHLSTISLYRVL